MTDTRKKNARGQHKVLMFAGKGGVGKTTCAAATALHYASQGEKTLAISTDPTPSLGHIFEVKDSHRPLKILDDLHIDEIGVEKVKQMWDGKFGREVYEVFSSFVAIEYNEFVEFMSSILPGLRDEFMVDFIREMTVGGDYNKVIWDTAPMGQTLGLLTMPSMLGKHLKAAPRIYSKLKLGRESGRPVLDVIKGWEKLSEKDLDFLRTEVGFVIVTIPEALAVEQLDGIFNEFAQYSFQIERLVINNVIRDTSSDFLRERADQQRHYIDMLSSRFPEVDRIELPMFPREIKGIDRIRKIEENLF